MSQPPSLLTANLAMLEGVESNSAPSPTFSCGWRTAVVVVKSPLRSQRVNERNRLIYKRGCQEHFSPSARCRGFDLRSIKGDVKNIFLPPPGAAVLICDIQPLSPRRRSGVVALNDCISAAGIFFSSDDADQFLKLASLVVVRCQPWIYLRLLA